VQRRGSECQRAAPFNYNTVAFDPRFSPDGDFIYFLATGNCSIQAGTANRTDTDVLRVNREVGAASVVNITKNARANHWSNHEISDFDISPDGTKLAFSAPRQFDSESRSIWIIDPNPDAENAPVFDCSRTAAGLEPMGLDGKKHCEFLFEERANAHVLLRDLRFHQVEVSAN
jgi:dipeptidyl aminopeptidase/acylaminoacyl peptidase